MYTEKCCYRKVETSNVLLSSIINTKGPHPPLHFGAVEGVWEGSSVVREHSQDFQV